MYSPLGNAVDNYAVSAGAISSKLGSEQAFVVVVVVVVQGECPLSLGKCVPWQWSGNSDVLIGKNRHANRYRPISRGPTQPALKSNARALRPA
jgi:hypothetical protein